MQVFAAAAQQRDVLLLLAERLSAARASFSSLASSRATMCRVCECTSAIFVIEWS